MEGLLLHSAPLNEEEDVECSELWGFDGYMLGIDLDAEPPEGDPNRKFKGRVVFQGNNVKGSNAAWAGSQDLSSNPANMEASKVVDAYRLFPGNTVEQADAQQAYTQSELEGIPTWVRLPADARPASWAGYRDPACPLRLALYGHPDSGGFWERHSEHN